MKNNNTIIIVKKELEKYKNFVIASIALAVFFGLEYFHEWANTLLVKLHFCNHFFCILFSIIFFAFAYFAWTKKRSYVNMALIVLIVGIVLMNFTYCDANGNMYLGDFSFGSFSMFSTNETICKPGVVCCEHDCTVPHPPCVETDSGRDYVSYGVVMSGVNIDDICLEDGNLRERYCNSELTYTSEDIDCAVEYGMDWTCIEGECRYSSTPTPPPSGPETNCGDGIDNDGDGLIDCADPDCDCGIFEYSCQHISEYPTCGGTCPPGYYCNSYVTELSGWCECVPDGEVACGSSKTIGGGLFCDGWCLNGDYCIHGMEGECYCSDFPCFDTDGGYFPEIEGFCVDNSGPYYDYCMSSTGLSEYTCGIYGCMPNQVNCIPYAGGSGVCVVGLLTDYCGSGLE